MFVLMPDVDRRWQSEWAVPVGSSTEAVPTSVLPRFYKRFCTRTGSGRAFDSDPPSGSVSNKYSSSSPVRVYVQ